MYLASTQETKKFFKYTCTCMYYEACKEAESYQAALPCDILDHRTQHCDKVILIEQHAVDIIPQLWLTVTILTRSEENVTLEAFAVFRLCSSVLGNTIFFPLSSRMLPLALSSMSFCCIGMLVYAPSKLPQLEYIESDRRRALWAYIVFNSGHQQNSSQYIYTNTWWWRCKSELKQRCKLLDSIPSSSAIT